MTIACTLAMITYVSITFVYLEHIDFFVLFLGFLCVGIITISINLYLLVSTYVDACVYMYIHVFIYTLYCINIIIFCYLLISIFMYILHQILCYYCQ